MAKMATGLENLNIYKLASELEIFVFNLTKKFPGDEKYRSVDQLRRSSSSVSNNIAESYHKRSAKEKVRILNDIVKGEAEETRKNLEICLKKGFHNDPEVANKYLTLLKMVSGYIRFVKEKKPTNLSTKELMN